MNNQRSRHPSIHSIQSDYEAYIRILSRDLVLNILEELIEVCDATESSAVSNGKSLLPATK